MNTKSMALHEEFYPDLRLPVAVEVTREQCECPECGHSHVAPSERTENRG